MMPTPAPITPPISTHMPTLETPQIAGHLLVQCLIAQGTRHVFGVPGESYLAALDGFHRYREHIAFVTNRHEGGAAFMAEAHGKLTGRPGVCFVTRAPGATNASIGVHTAFQDSTPMVLLIGDVASDTRDREAFQEMDYRAMFGPSTMGMAKRVERIDDAARIPEYVARAFATALNGRPGPVVLVLPEDMLRQPLPQAAQTAQTAQGSVGCYPLPCVQPANAWPDPQQLAQLQALLAQAQRPFVIVGGPGWSPQSAQALQRFAENWNLPVGNAFRFQDTFDNHHPQYAGDVGIGINPALAQRIRASDLVLAVGARLGEMTTNSYQLLAAPQTQQTLVHIHCGAEELNRVYQAQLAIQASMHGAAHALAALPAPAQVAWSEWTQGCHADYQANLVPSVIADLPTQNPTVVDMPRVIDNLQRHLPKDAVLTNGAGNFASWLHRYYRYTGLASGHKTQLAPTNGAMGYGVPAGIAAAITTGRTVVTLTGDGDFLMNGQELATAVQHGAKTIIVLLNNGMFGTIRMHQERDYPQHTAGTHLNNPDFAALARAYGYAGVAVRDSADFEAELLAALARPNGTLIEIVLEPELITTRSTLRAITQAATNAAGQATTNAAGQAVATNAT